MRIRLLLVALLLLPAAGAAQDFTLDLHEVPPVSERGWRAMIAVSMGDAVGALTVSGGSLRLHSMGGYPTVDSAAQAMRAMPERRFTIALMSGASAELELRDGSLISIWQDGQTFCDNSLAELDDILPLTLHSWGVDIDDPSPLLGGTCSFRIETLDRGAAVRVGSFAESTPFRLYRDTHVGRLYVAPQEPFVGMTRDASAAAVIRLIDNVGGPWRRWGPINALFIAPDGASGLASRVRDDGALEWYMQSAALPNGVLCPVCLRFYMDARTSATASWNVYGLAPVGAQEWSPGDPVYVVNDDYAGRGFLCMMPGGVATASLRGCPLEIADGETAAMRLPPFEEIMEPHSFLIGTTVDGQPLKLLHVGSITGYRPPGN